MLVGVCIAFCTAACAVATLWDTGEFELVAAEAAVLLEDEPLPEPHPARASPATTAAATVARVRVVLRCGRVVGVGNALSFVVRSVPGLLPGTKTYRL
jgi:hypothetical protein